ncbi:MAG: nucleotidyltransferase family protein [Cytophagaceae bacterium]|jgi:dTDP-glucose pyrophosphorylase|nr:nucleotidyltransferase family protein [Cytophagaceae bacterium]
MEKYQQHFIKETHTIREALIRLNDMVDFSVRVLFVLNEEFQLIGTVTDGDIRRSLIRGSEVSHPISEAMNKNFKFLQKGNINISELIRFREEKYELIPLLDTNRNLVRIIDFSEQASCLPLEAVLMAGGKGERLRPLTEKVPKPMLYVGDKPILEHNIDRLVHYGLERIHVSLGYLPDSITSYFKGGEHFNCDISYVYENNPLGTIGALSLIDDFQEEVILLMNSDILSNINFEEFYLEFINSGAGMSIASIPYTVNVPYAVLETTNGQVKSFVEKPTYTHYSNAGIYLIRREFLNRIPKSQFFNATDLIDVLLSEGVKVTSFPILGYWLDIGKHEDFKKAQEDIKHLKLK